MVRLSFILICLITFPAFSQDLTLNQVLKLRSSNQEYISKKLLKKGWSVMVDNPPSTEFMGRAVWAFNPVEKGNMEMGAVSWCVFYYSPKTSPRLLYNYFDEENLRKIENKIKRRKMVSIESGNQLRGVSSLESYEDYGDDKLVIRIFIYEKPNKFGIKIFEKKDYLDAKINNRL